MPQGKSAESCEKIQQTNWNHFLVNILSNVLVFAIKRKYISSQTQVRLKQNTSTFQGKYLSVLIKTYLPFLRRHRRLNKHLIYSNLHKSIPIANKQRAPKDSLQVSGALYVLISLYFASFKSMPLLRSVMAIRRTQLEYCLSSSVCFINFKLP